MQLLNPAKIVPLAVKQLTRNRWRSALAVIGVALGFFVFAAVETLQAAIRKATSVGAEDATLVVYRENRYCPAASRLPIYYEEEIRRIPGVVEVIPIQITVNNCGASLDIITFRGVPPERLMRYAPEIRIVSGSLEQWLHTDDGALLGESFARRRGLKPGDAFSAAGVRVRVSGIIRSPHPQDNDVAYVHLPFLQQASRRGLGEVTQFNVRVDDPSRLQAVASAIDERFRSAPEPTRTAPEKAFFAAAAGDLLELAGYSRWIGWGAVLAVFGLIANAIILAVRSRVREVGILQTLGFSSFSIAALVVLEGVFLGLAGGLIGTAASWLALARGNFSFGNDGQILTLAPDPTVMIMGLITAIALGAIAAATPAFIAARQSVVASLRS